MENNNTIIFRMGEETGIVIERENFNKSLFKEHYVKALQIANDIIGRQEQNASSNVIAFCADRGEGKTSCMQTIAGLLTIEERYDKFKEEIPEANVFTNINPKDLHRLAIIDPAFFDEKHNIIELITGMMYETLQEENEDCNKHTVSDTTKLVAKFRDVQKSLEYIEKASSTEAPIYDALEKVQTLSQGLILRQKIDELMDLYLKYIGKERLVVCVDDIDLNIQYAYRMTEQLRKYLSNPHCLILFAANIEQLTMVIRHSMEKELYGRIIEGEDQTCQEMAAKYVTKLLPTSQQIKLVHLTDLYEQPLLLQDAKGNAIERWDKVKEAISQLIYAKTRYLFYNNESETSPIVPKNLRGFRHLMRLLTNMHDFNNVQLREEIDEKITEEQKVEYNRGKENKSTFRNYFYQDWTANNLTAQDYDFAQTLVEYTDVSGINLLVVQYLRTRFKLNTLSKNTIGNETRRNTKATKANDEFKSVLNLSEEEELENEMEERLERNVTPSVYAIVDYQNKSYNISLGDVFYLLAYLQRGSTSIEDKMLLFFIKSFYSMRLYEYYDVITEQKGTLYPIRETTGNRISIYRVDDTYENTNILQRFVNGSFFTYLPNEFMAFDATKRMARDLRFIRADEVRKLFKEVIQNFPEDGKEVTPLMKLKFQMCEFLCWTISRTSYAPQGGDYINAALLDRKQNTPACYGDFRPKTTLYVFDITAPFYNALNIRYAYNRIKVVKDKDFYELAKMYPDSLLNQAIRKTIVDRTNQWAKTDEKTTEEKKKEIIEESKTRDLKELDYYTMLSSAIIRNADVLISLRDHIVSKKNDVSKEGANTLQLLSLFYKEIIKSEMYTYKTDDDRNYEIRFSCYDALVSFLNEFIPGTGKSLTEEQAQLEKWLSEVLFAVPKKTRGKAAK